MTGYFWLLLLTPAAIGALATGLRGATLCFRFFLVAVEDPDSVPVAASRSLLSSALNAVIVSRQSMFRQDSQVGLKSSPTSELQEESMYYHHLIIANTFIHIHTLLARVMMMHPLIWGRHTQLFHIRNTPAIMPFNRW